MKPVKWIGTMEDLLEDLFTRIIEHEDHFLFYSLTDFDWGQIRCSKCRLVVVEGTRELIESLWLEHNNQSSPSKTQ